MTLRKIFNELKNNLDNDRFKIEQSAEDECVFVSAYDIRENINLLCTVSRTDKYFWAQLRFYEAEGSFAEVKRVSVPGRTMQELINNINEEIDEFKHKDISKLHSMII